MPEKYLTQLRRIW